MSRIRTSAAAPPIKKYLHSVRNLIPLIKAQHLHFGVQYQIGPFAVHTEIERAGQPTSGSYRRQSLSLGLQVTRRVG